jgi:hypothetical protein
MSFEKGLPMSASFRSRVGVASLLLALVAAVVPASAWAVSIQFDNSLVIADGSLWDLDSTVNNIVVFDSTVTFPGALASGYDVKGTVDLVAGSTLSNILAPAVHAIRLTNFVADRPLAALGGNLDIEFFHAFTAGPYPVITAADTIQAEVSNGNGAAVYANNASGNPVPAGTDVITNWQGFVSGVIITNPTGGPLPLNNPNFPGGAGTLPYTTFGHGPAIIPGPFLNPVVGGFLSFSLGNVRDQLILPSSAEVGLNPVPEPSSVVLFSLGAGAVALAYGRRRKK